MDSSNTKSLGKKKCPFCAEEIQAEAVKCKHCGSQLQGTQSAEHKGKALFGVVWLLTFVCGLFVISFVSTLGDFLIFGPGHDQENSLNMLTTWTVLTVCAVVAMKTAKKHVRKDKTISLFGWWNPDFRNKEVRRKAAWFSAVVSGITAVVAIISLMTGGADSSTAFLVLVLIVLFALAAYFTYRMSRVASILGLSVYGIGVLMSIAVLISSDYIPPASANQVSTVSWLVRLLFLVFLVNGVRATFAEHADRK